jgi:hypothetical protein
MTVKVAEKAFKFRDLLVANIVPDFEYGAVGPEVPLGAPVTSQTGPNPAARGHADIDDVVASAGIPPSWHLAIKDVNASKTGRQPGDVFELDVFESTADKSEWALWHCREMENRLCRYAIFVAVQRFSQL